jgi:hypothetical protein
MIFWIFLLQGVIRRIFSIDNVLAKPERHLLTPVKLKSDYKLKSYEYTKTSVADTRWLPRSFLGVHKKHNQLSNFNFLDGNGLFSGLAITYHKFLYVWITPLTISEIIGAF